jgi:ATP-dependent helicase/nuclease subunit A
MTRKFKVTIAGCGGMANKWVQYALSRKDIEIAALMDIKKENAQAMAEKYDIKCGIYDNLKEAIRESNSNLLFDITIPDAHRETVITAMKMGCDVFGEKPMASSIEEAREMVISAHELGKSYSVMQNRRYLKDIRALRGLIEQGAIGELGFISADFFLGPHFGGFREIMESPLILDMAIHTFDQARFITGADAVSVYCHEFNPPGSWYKGNASAICIFEMSDGSVFCYRGSWCAEGAPTSPRSPDAIMVASLLSPPSRLVERIIQRIMDPKDSVDIDRLLVVTFTNAAATEMKERIGDALSDALENDPESEVLQRQLALLNRASITTIHSFCLEVIKNNFHQLDIDPNFRIANETEGLLLKLEALEELFEDRYLQDEMDEDFLDLVESYSSNRDDKRLQDMVLGLYDFVQSHPWPEEWLHNHSRAFNIPYGTDLGNTPWGKELLESTRVEVMGLAESMAQAIDIIKGDPGLQPYLKNFVEEHSAIEAILKGFHEGWESVHDYVSKVDFKRLPRYGKDADKDKQEQVKKIRDNVKAGIKRIQDRLFAIEPDQVIRDLRSLYPRMKCLIDLVLELGERYQAKKRDKGLVDFNDLEHMCLEILLDEDENGERIPSEIALNLRERYEEVLVDEYQDSNLVQEVILSTISRKYDQRPNMFMVGDVKQSIYRFRQARPDLFLEKYFSYSLKPGSRDRKIQLFKNFRSRKSIIDGVNFIFSQIMSKNVGELDYDDEEALNLGAVFKEGAHGEPPEGEPIEFHIIDMKDDAFPEDAEPYQNTSSDYGDLGEDDEDGEDGDEGARGEPLDIIQTEARIIARRILELVSPEGKGKPARIFDKAKGDYRKAEFRDIVILLRTTVNWADTFQEELSLQGIPVYSDSGTGYFKTIEVQTMLSLLQIIDNPMQDIPLLAVLRSPIESWSPEELIDVRLVDRESTFYEALVKKAQEGEDRLAQKARAFIDKLNRWRDISQYMSTDELIWYLYGETGYYSCVGALPGGVQRQANLRILFERARQYEETSYKGLFNFILYIDRLKTGQGDMGSAKILGENENVVRIMSIHKSKGLEFPIVFVAGCGKQFNLMRIKSMNFVCPLMIPHRRDL